MSELPSASELKAGDYPLSKLWTVKQLAELCELSQDYLWRLVREGRIKSVKIGRSVRIRHKDYLNFIAEE